MELKDFKLSDISQTQIDTYCVISLTHKDLNCQSPRNRRKVVTEAGEGRIEVK